MYRDNHNLSQGGGIGVVWAAHDRTRGSLPPCASPEQIDQDPCGPHFTARMDEISLVANTRRTKADRPFTPVANDMKAILAVDTTEAPFFRAMLAPVRDDGARGIAVEDDAWEALALHHSSPVVVLPIE